MPIKNMLIDLGGVLLEIDIDSTLQKYRALRAPEAGQLDYGKEGQDLWFSKLDKGEVSIEEFADGLKDSFQLQASREEIIQIWADLLKPVFPGRLEAINQLAAKYNLALLSNTSEYHFGIYEPECRPMFEQMEHIFTSFEMGVSKPDAAIYEQAFERSGWKAEETIFLDDSKQNIEGAKAVGLHAFWIETPDHFLKMMEEYG